MLRRLGAGAVAPIQRYAGGRALRGCGASASRHARFLPLPSRLLDFAVRSSRAGLKLRSYSVELLDQFRDSLRWSPALFLERTLNLFRRPILITPQLSGRALATRTRPLTNSLRAFVESFVAAPLKAEQSSS